MKNLFYLSVLVLSAGLTACASDDVETRSYRYAAAPEMAPAGSGTDCTRLWWLPGKRIYR